MKIFPIFIGKEFNMTDCPDMRRKRGKYRLYHFNVFYMWMIEALGNLDQIVEDLVGSIIFVSFVF